MRNPNRVLVAGAQWGDEGKGKIVDMLAQNTHVGIRGNGGDNAGHTVEIEGETLKLNIFPATILNSEVISMIGSGVAFNPLRAIAEKAYVENYRGEIAQNQLAISPMAALVLAYHQELDGHHEKNLGGRAIGTTRRGIGPAYQDKAERSAMRVFDLLDADRFLKKLGSILEEKKHRYPGLADRPEFQASFYEGLISEAGQQLGPYVRDTVPLVHQHLINEHDFVIEGAHGTLLDVECGTHPYVTSCKTTVDGIAAGADFPASELTSRLGVVKSYETRVGAGPMPTERTDEWAEEVREKGNERGTTTGRDRRIGDFDGEAAVYAQRLNYFTDIAITKPDVLSDMGPVNIVTYLDEYGRRVGFRPYDEHFLNTVRLDRESFDGWTSAEVAGAESVADLPANLQRYLGGIMLHFLPGAKLRFVGMGPGRDQIIRL